jgi:hypothetical protein
MLGRYKFPVVKQLFECVKIGVRRKVEGCRVSFRDAKIVRDVD